MAARLSAKRLPRYSGDFKIKAGVFGRPERCLLKESQTLKYIVYAGDAENGLSHRRAVSPRQR